MAYRWTMHRLYDASGNDTAGPQPLSLWWLARAAAEETLQGSPLAASWLKLFRSHLDPNEGYWLKWSEDLAQSAELRRAYSGLYGRFAARAMLTAHLGLSRFVSLKRDGIQIPGSIHVKREKKGDIPDWVAWDDRAGRHVLCEAKGSLTANDFLAAGTPKCVAEGKAQFGRVTSTGPSGALHPACWVAASRWSTELRGGQAATLLWDPPTDYEPFPEEALRGHREAMTRAWLDSLAPGLGWRDSGELLSERRIANALTIRADPGSIRTEDDWPPIPDEPRETLAPAQVRREDTQKVFEQLASTSSREMLYKSDWVDHERPREKVPLKERFISALVTPFGVRPIRDLTDVEELLRAQERARAHEQPAMVIGLPLRLDPAERMSDVLWLDGAGISRAGDLAVFDLRHVDVESEKISAT